MADFKNNSRPGEKFSILVSLHNDCPDEYINKWVEIQNILHNPIKNPNFYKRWASLCQLEENKSLPPLERCEGGLGGSSNWENKQCRIDVSKPGHYPAPGGGFIGEVKNSNRHFKVRFENSSDGKDIWIFNQLIDLCQSLETLLTEMMGEKCIDCIIVYKCTNRYAEKEILEPTPLSIIRIPRPSENSNRGRLKRKLNIKLPS
jgi:hypothetical protein